MSNTVKQLKDFFSTPEKPVSASEMMLFWKSLNDTDKEYYNNADLS